MSTQARADILLKISADIAELTKTIKETKNAESSFLDLAKSGAALGLGFHGVDEVFSGLREAIKSTIVEGVKFNGTMETMRISFAGMLRNFAPTQFRTFNEALIASDDLMTRLRTRANELGISFEGLAETYKTTAGVLFSSGITSAEKQLSLVVTLQKALQSLGVTGFQATRDVQDILTGLSQRTKAGRELGLNDEEIKRAREGGKLFEYLTEKLAGFNEAAGQSANTLEAVEARLHNVKDATFADATKELTASYKGLLVALTDLVQSDGFKEFARVLSNVTAGAVENARKLVQAFTINDPNKSFTDRAKDLAKDLDSAQSAQDVLIAKRRAETQRKAILAAKAQDYDGLGDGLKNSSYGQELLRSYSDQLVALDHIIDKANKQGQQIADKNALEAKGAQERATDRLAAEAHDKLVETSRKKELSEYDAHVEKKRREDEAALNLIDRRKSLEKDLAEAQGQPLKIAHDYLTTGETASGDPKARAEAQRAADSANFVILGKISEIKHEIAATDKAINAETDKSNKEYLRVQGELEKDLARQYTETARKELESAEVHRREIENNVYLTKEEKRKALSEAIKEENAAIDKNVELLKKRQSLTTNEVAKNQIENTVNSLGKKKEVNVADLDTKYADQSLGQKVEEQFARIKDGFLTVAEAIGQVTRSLTSDLSTNLDKLIHGTITLKQGFQAIGYSIQESVVKAFTDMVADFIVQRLIMDNVNSLFRAKDVAEEEAAASAKVGVHVAGETTKTAVTGTQSLSRKFIILGETIFHGLHVALRVAGHIAGEIAKTATTVVQGAIRIGVIIAESIASVIHGAVQAFSALASIPYVGPFLGAAAMAAALVAGFALVRGIGKGFRSGGYTGDGHPDEEAGTVHKGEVVFSQEDIARAGGVAAVEQMRMGGGASSVNNMRMSRSELADGSAVSSPAQSTNGVVQAFFNTKQDARDWLRSQSGRREMIDFMRQSRSDV